MEAVTVFRSSRIAVHQQKRDRKPDADNSGWMAWECANVMLRILENRPSDVFLPVPVPGSPDSPLKGQLVLDVSAGGGLCSIGAAVAGATVIATDIPEQLDLLQLNVEAAAPVIAATGAGGSIRVSPLFWGAPLEPVIGSLRPRVAILSDLLFIALRDGFTDVLIATLVSLARSCDCVLFGFEERLIYEETEFMDNLTSASAGALAVIELKGVYASKAERLQGAGGPAAEDAVIDDDMFWEPPPLRVFRLTLVPSDDAASSVAE